MREIIFSTETGSDVPQAMADQFHIRIIPTHIIMDGVDYLDGPDFPVEEAYAYYERTKKAPTTSCVNVDEYIDFFRKIREEQPDCVIMHFAYSSAASATCQNAQAASEKFRDVYVIDTKNVTAGCTVYIRTACDLIQKKAGLTIDYPALAEEIRGIAPRISCAFIPGNLEFLRAGGSVSDAAYLGATILQLKPLIEIDAGGALVASKRYQGSMEKVAGRFVREFVANHELDRETLHLIYTLGISDEALHVVDEATRELGFKECVHTQICGALTCHSGPGSIGLAGIAEE